MFNRRHQRHCRRQKALLLPWSSSLGRLSDTSLPQRTRAHRLPPGIMEKEVFNRLSTRTTVSAAAMGRFPVNSTENLSHQPKTQCLQGLELRPQVSFLLECCSTTTLNFVADLRQIWLHPLVIWRIARRMKPARVT